MSRALKSTASFLPLTSPSRHGFSLVELAIVLSVIGLIFGGIWIAGAKANQANRVNQTLKNVATIIQQYRALYANVGVIDINNRTDITCQGVNGGFFPKDMLLPNTPCVTGNTATYPQHPWGSYLAVYRNAGLQQVTPWFYNLTYDECISFGAALQSSPDVQTEVINQANGSGGGPTGARVFPPLGTDAPFTIADLDALCLPNNTNLISAGFRIR